MILDFTEDFKYQFIREKILTFKSEINYFTIHLITWLVFHQESSLTKGDTACNSQMISKNHKRYLTSFYQKPKLAFPVFQKVSSSASLPQAASPRLWLSQEHHASAEGIGHACHLYVRGNICAIFHKCLSFLRDIMSPMGALGMHGTWRFPRVYHFILTKTTIVLCLTSEMFYFFSHRHNFKTSYWCLHVFTQTLYSNISLAPLFEYILI